MSGKVLKKSSILSHLPQLTCQPFHKKCWIKNPYLAWQGQPGDRHVAVQHLELGLQRKSHTGSKGEGKGEREKNKVKFSERELSARASCANGKVITVVVWVADHVIFIM